MSEWIHFPKGLFRSGEKICPIEFKPLDKFKNKMSNGVNLSNISLRSLSNLIILSRLSRTILKWSSSGFVILSSKNQHRQL